jgi:NAD(P)H-hydrate epimerase
MKTITPKEMAIIDENSHYLGIPPLLLMENAGRSVADFVKKKLEDSSGKKVVIITGLGNNGGDGFVCARHLACEQIEVTVILLGNPGTIRTNEALINWKTLENMNCSVRCLIIYDLTSLESIKKEVKEADIIVDAIFGTGMRGKIGQLWSSAIDIINSAKGLKISIDIPSGLDPLTGIIHDKSIKASFTITMHRIKRGLLKNKKHSGEVLVSSIGIPPEAETTVGPGDLRYTLRPRDRFSKKGDFGRLLVIGGSKDYSGAPALSSMAALRTGVDLVIVAAPKSVSDTIRSFSPNLIVRNLSSDYLVPKDLQILKKIVSSCTSIIIGPGLGLEKETLETITRFIREVKNIPLLVDADGLRALSKNPTIHSNSPTVLTPHSGEFNKLSNNTLAPPDRLGIRKDMIHKEAKRRGLTILLKAYEDIISDGVNLKTNLTGNPGMTVGGTGDVLSGIVAAFLSWKITPFRAACSGAFISGLAGNMAVKERGHHILATDVIEKIPEVMINYEKIKTS